MPRHNVVNCIGMVLAYPQIRMKEGKIVKMAIPILTAFGGSRSYGERQTTMSGEVADYRIANLWIATNDSSYYSLVRDLKPGDMVECKGCIRTIDNKKSFICANCGTKNIYLSSALTIYPIYLGKREKSFALPEGCEWEGERADKSKELAIKYIEEHLEIADSAMVIGVVAEEPQIYHRESDGMDMITLCMAIRRKYFINEDDMSKNVDFPFVKLYGDFVSRHRDRLKAHQLILIDGALQSRNITRKITCSDPNCGCKFRVPDVVTELVPYSIEYLKDDISEKSARVADENKEAENGIRTIGSEADIDLQNISYKPQLDAAGKAVLDSVEDN